MQELDTTLQVLGIDGDVQKPLAPVRITTSVHTPLVDETPLAPRRTASIASSSVFFSPRAGFGRTPSDAAFRYGIIALNATHFTLDEHALR